MSLINKKMKDLTHYFVSPTKSSEKTLEEEEEEEEEVRIENDPNANNNNKDNVEQRKKTDEDKNEVKDKEERKKRSRVKVRISLKGTKKNSRCDIIESANDLIDKTPSPLNRKEITEGRDMNDDNNSTIDKKTFSHGNNEIQNSVRIGEDTPNAFQLLMTRNKSSNHVAAQKDYSLLTLTPPSSQKSFGTLTFENDNEERRRKKEISSQIKRKHDEIEEIKLSGENRLGKRPKLIKQDIKDSRDQTPKMKKKDDKNRKKDRAMQRKDIEENSIDRNTIEGKKNHDRDQEVITFPKAEYFGKEDTPRSKTKWTMRVKLQSHSDDNDDDKGNISEDDDLIFTPKSKGKYKKKRIRKNSSSTEREIKEEKKPEEIEIEMPKIEEIIETSSTPDLINLEFNSSKKRGKHRAKTNSNKLKSAEMNPKEETNDSIKSVGDCSVEIIEELLIAPSNDRLIVLQEKKLAPLFVRRSKPNPAVLEARRSFLQSGIPEAVKKIISEQKPYSNDVGISTMPFPKISHVPQSEIEIPSPEFAEESNGKGPESFYKQKSGSTESIVSLSLNPNDFKSVSNLREENLKENEKDNKIEKFIKIERENIETVLKDVESRCSETRTMWERILSAGSNRVQKKSPFKKRGKKLKLRKSDSLEYTQDNLDSLNPTWTSKYKPITSVQVVGNDSAVNKLRIWLSGWRLPSPKDDHSSGDEFYSSDCSSASLYENNQVAVLLGPHGSGKTASVYAIAEELGYRVLEVNASSRRTGKKILSDFQEATKSHRVKRDQGQKLLMPVKKKSTERKVPQNSLILIEDVDLIFEEDEGFVSATFQLAANTRRPIVMTCKEPCAHLHRMAPQQQFIHFQTANDNRVQVQLELIALAESGYRLSRSCLDILLRNGDMRQSLLQLQYILLSGPPSISQLDVSPSSTLWVDMQSQIYKPAIKSSKKNRKECETEKKGEERRLIEIMAKKLDNLSLISSLTDVENPASPPWRRKLNPSLSLLEDYEPYSNSDNLSRDIADWLRIASFESNGKISTRESSSESKSQIAIKRRVKLGIDLALSQAMPSTLEHRSKSTDYLPILRNICRSEEDRASINTKRGRRFHNYLHGLNLASASSNILSAASSVFKEKSLSNNS